MAKTDQISECETMIGPWGYAQRLWENERQNNTETWKTILNNEVDWILVFIQNQHPQGVLVTSKQHGISLG